MRKLRLRGRELTVYSHTAEIKESEVRSLLHFKTSSVAAAGELEGPGKELGIGGGSTCPGIPHDTGPGLGRTGQESCSPMLS